VPAFEKVRQELGVVAMVRGAERPKDRQPLKHVLALGLSKKRLAVAPHLERSFLREIRASGVDEKQEGAPVLARTGLIGTGHGATLGVMVLQEKREKRPPLESWDGAHM